MTAPCSPEERFLQKVSWLPRRSREPKGGWGEGKGEGLGLRGQAIVKEGGGDVCSRRALLGVGVPSKQAAMGAMGTMEGREEADRA